MEWCETQRTIEITLLLSLLVCRAALSLSFLLTHSSSLLVVLLDLLVTQTRMVPTEDTECTPTLKSVKVSNTLLSEHFRWWRIWILECVLFILPLMGLLYWPDYEVGPHLGIHYLVFNRGLVLLTLFKRNWVWGVGQPIDVGHDISRSNNENQDI